MKAVVVVVVLALAGCAGGAEVSGTQAGVEQTLDALHDAASKADGARYFDLFTPDGVFLGTDATERWTLAQFKAYAEPHFSKGKGWTYTVLERHVALHGDTAWFDERLQNAKLGECRGSGALVWSDGRWRIAQYNLTIPIPNAIAVEVADRIKALPEGKAE